MRCCSVSCGFFGVSHHGTVNVTFSVLDCTQSLSFLLVVEKLERARCAAACETGASEMRGRVRDWSERGRRWREWGRGKRKHIFRPFSPFSARLCLSLAPISCGREKKGSLQSARGKYKSLASNSSWNGQGGKLLSAQMEPYCHEAYALVAFSFVDSEIDLAEKQKEQHKILYFYK